MPKCQWQVDFERVPVVQLSGEGKFIARHDSIRKASQSIFVKPTNVCNVVSGRVLSVKGFIFIREEYYNPEVKISLKFLKFKRKVKRL